MEATEDSSRPQRRFPALLLLLLAGLVGGRAIVGSGNRAGTPSSGIEFSGSLSQDRIRWAAHSLAPALATKSGKPILYDFTAEWCSPCQVLAREVFADPEAARLINDNFVPVQLVDRQREDGRNIPAVTALQERFGVDAFPTLVVARADGTPIEIQRGYFGRAGTERFLRDTLEKAGRK